MSLEVANDDNSKKKRITFKLMFIDSYRFIQRKLSDLVDNLSEINKKECLECMERKKIECEFIRFKNDRLECGKRFPSEKTD